MFMHPATLKPYSPQMVRRMHNEIIKEAGIDHIRYADLRHTCAILALQERHGCQGVGADAGPLPDRRSPGRTMNPICPTRSQKDEGMPNEATQSELQQAANILDDLLKF